MTASPNRRHGEPPLPGGIWGFPVSIFGASGDLDAPGLAAGVRYQVDGGVSAIVVNGALAEIDSLDAVEWGAAAEAAVDAADGRVPVIAALPTEEATALAAARQAAGLGVAALLVLPLRDDPLSLIDHARRAADLAAAPTVLYQREEVRLDVRELQTAVGDRTVIGLKDGTRDLRAFRRLLDELDERIVTAAAFEDMSLPYWALGVDALCPASVAHDPAYSALWHSLLATGQVAEARRVLAAFAYPFTDLRLSRPGIDVAVVKEAMAARGLSPGPVRPPGQTLRPVERAAVHRLLERLDSVVVRW